MMGTLYLMLYLAYNFFKQIDQNNHESKIKINLIRDI